MQLCASTVIYCGISPVMLYPDDGDVLTLCGNDVLSITCVANNGQLRWSLDGTDKTFSHILDSNNPVYLGNSVTVVLVSSSMESSTSVAIVSEAKSTLNNSVLTCSDAGTSTKRKTFLIAGTPYIGIIVIKIVILGAPSKPIDVNFKAVNSSSATIHWMPPVDNSKCIAHYVVYLENVDMIYNSTTTSLSVSSLEKDEEQLVKVAAVDRMGCVGENATILMNLTGIYTCIQHTHNNLLTINSSTESKRLDCTNLR